MSLLTYMKGQKVKLCRLTPICVVRFPPNLANLRMVVEDARAIIASPNFCDPSNSLAARDH